MPVTAHIALGSNLGDARRNLQRALQALAGLNEGLLKVSSLWVSQPEGFAADVQDFYNAVISLQTSLGPEQLLLEMQDIERQLGQGVKRRVAGGYESRLIDLDLIDYEGREIDTPGLQLPHPRASGRRFVLVPLQEITPEFTFSPNVTLVELIEAAAPNPMINEGPLLVA